ncbi:DUF6783 domain-containing protein [Ruminococcus sp. RTP21484sp1_RTP31003st1_F6_RTP31003_210430]|uniref:DUF6783 domain-containing protein n=1 Tax=Clostridia TaxID=186801 RepID=UPI0034A1A1A7
MNSFHIAHDHTALDHVVKRFWSVFKKAFCKMCVTICGRFCPKFLLSIAFALSRFIAGTGYLPTITDLKMYLYYTL